MRRAIKRTADRSVLCALVTALILCIGIPAFAEALPDGEPANGIGIMNLYGLASASYDGGHVSVINDNVPKFTDEDRALLLQESPQLSELDYLGRCGTASMLAGPETLTYEKRGEIGHVKPAGWHTVKYPEVIEDKYLFNRTHLLGWSISKLLDDPRNLTTGTRQCNLEMTNYEIPLAQYIENTGNHVFYRVTPLFEGENLVPYGILMEASSCEDGGSGLSFCVLCWNRQDGVIIDYATGDSRLDENGPPMLPTVEGSGQEGSEEVTFVLNTSSGKFHLPSCDSVSEMAEHNKKEMYISYDEMVAAGYAPCKRCFS